MQITENGNKYEASAMKKSLELSDDEARIVFNRISTMRGYKYEASARKKTPELSDDEARIVFNRISTMRRTTACNLHGGSASTNSLQKRSRMTDSDSEDEIPLSFKLVHTSKSAVSPSSEEATLLEDKRSPFKNESQDKTKTNTRTNSVGHTSEPGKNGGYLFKANSMKPGQVSTFIALCVHEVRRKGKFNGSLHEQSWSNIKEQLKERSGLNFGRTQLEEQWNILKAKYKVWSDLMDAATESGTIPTHHTQINWNDEKWNDYVKKNPAAKQFRREGLGYADKLKFLFASDGSTASAHISHPSANETSKIKVKVIRMENRSSDEESAQENGKSESPSPTEVHSGPEISHEQAGKQDTITNARTTTLDEMLQKNTKRKDQDDSSAFIDQMESVLKTTKRNDEATITKCNEVLDSMMKLKMDSTTYIAACSIFCLNQVYREQWMMLSKKPEDVRISWILMIAKSLGLV